MGILTKEKKPGGRTRVDRAFLDLERWPMVDRESLEKSGRDRFDRRAAIIRAYVTGMPLRAIDDTWDVSAVEVRRLFLRCLQLHDDGRIYGYRALICGIQVKPYTRTMPSGEGSRTMAGELTRLFDTYPEILAAVVKEFLGQYPKGFAKESRVSIKYAHRLFVRMCRAARIRSTDYPFNTKELGRRSEGSGMPTELFPQLHWAVPSELWLDNAKAHYANLVRDKLIRELGRVSDLI